MTQGANYMWLSIFPVLEFRGREVKLLIGPGSETNERKVLELIGIISFECVL